MPPSQNAISADCAVNVVSDASSTTSGLPSICSSESFTSFVSILSAKPSGMGYATARTSRQSSAGAHSNFGAGSFTPDLGPSTTTLLATRRRIACSGFTQGPPLWLHPGELNRPISMSSALAVSNAVARAFSHSGEKVFTGPCLFPPPPMSPM